MKLRQLTVLALLLPGFAVSQSHYTQVTGEEILERLRTERPRLMLTQQRLAELRAQSIGDAALRSYVAAMLAEADKRVAGPFDGSTVGGQSLFTSFVQLGLAWHWTGESKYAEAAIALMQGVNQRNTLAGANELQLGMMTNGTALGYDWFYEVLPDPVRNRARELLAEAIERCIRQYGGRNGEFTRNWWVTNEFNWNSVINGSFILGTLAVADEVVEPVQWLLPRILPNLRRTIDIYNPDGVFAEGVGYWMYGTMHLVYGLASLESALGSDFGLSANAPGLENTGNWVIAANSPIDRDATFADPGLNWWSGNRHPLYWLAKRYNQPDLAARMLWYTTQRKPDYPEFSVLWYPQNPPVPHPYRLPLDNLFSSVNANAPMAITRSHATDRDALWAYIKGGNHQKMQHHHGHLDIGSFELGALAEHWAHDLAADSYSIQTGNDRFERVYRMSTRSHNTLLIDNKNQPIHASADFIGYASDDSGMRAVLDMSRAYPDARRALRGLASVNGRRAMLVQDEIELPGQHRLTWGMMTDKIIELDGATATLRRGLKTLRARILEPEGAVFTSESAYQAPPQNPNTGFNRLLVELPDANGAIRISVLLSPVWADGEVTSVPVIPLTEWMDTEISEPEPEPVPGTAILFDQPSSAAIGTTTGGSMPLQTIDAIASGIGAIGPQAMAALTGVHINSHWADSDGRIFAQSQGLPQTRNYLAFSNPNGYGNYAAVRFVFDLGNRSDTFAGGYNFTGPRIVATAGNSIYLGESLAEPTGGYAITFGSYSSASTNESVFGFTSATESGSPYRVRAAGFILSGIASGKTMTADFHGSEDRLLARLTAVSPGETTAGENAAGGELFFAHDAGLDVENWIHRIVISGDGGGNVGFDDFSFSPIHASAAHPWHSSDRLDEGGDWRLTNLGPIQIRDYPWVYNLQLDEWCYFLPASQQAEQIAWLHKRQIWIYSNESLHGHYFNYQTQAWQIP